MYNQPDEFYKPFRYTRLKRYGSMHEPSLIRIDETLRGALAVHPNLTIIRIDLRYPNQGAFSDDMMERDCPTYFAHNDDGVMKRFIASLKAKINAQWHRHQNTNNPLAYSDLIYVWAMEFGSGYKPHYHLALMVNADRFPTLGDYQSSNSLAGMIKQAWASALGGDPIESVGCVEFVRNGVHHLSQYQFNEYHHSQNIRLIKGLSYLAKKKTKVINPSRRTFGFSSLPRLERLAMELHEF